MGVIPVLVDGLKQELYIIQNMLFGHLAAGSIEKQGMDLDAASCYLKMLLDGGFDALETLRIGGLLAG